MADAAALSAFLPVLFDKFALLKSEVEKLLGVEEELKNLTSTVRTIKAILKDASGNQNRSETMSTYLRDLKDVAYDVNDVLDEFKTEATRRRLQRFPEVRNSTSAVNPKRLWFQHGICERVSEISKKLDTIVRNINLRPRVNEPPHPEEGLSGSSSLSRGSRAFGREKEVEYILRVLTTDQHDVEGLFVIPIQGPPGTGKTFLARVVYNDVRVDTHFHPKIWVHVPSIGNGFDIQKLTKATLEAIEQKHYPNLQLENLVYDLKSKLEGRRFLMVLDAVCNLSHEAWEELLVPLRYAARGSGILVTTQAKSDARVIGAEPICLEKLSHDDTRSLFCQVAFDDPNGFESRPPMIQKNIEKIVRKCLGLPLAAKIVGRLLRFETDHRRWENILQSDIILQGQMLNSYMASYQLLPYHLRLCFDYMAVFPRGYKFEKNVLIQLWMAQDYICTTRGKRVEDVGSECFDSLMDLSCFHELSPSGGDPPKYRVDEQFHQLACELSKEECCIFEHGNELSDTSSIRHSCIFCNHSSQGPPSSDHSRQSIVSLHKAEGLYTLLLMGDSRSCDIVALSNLAKHCTRLRTIDLSSTSIKVLKDSIKKFKLLRYLNLSNTDIRSLPKPVTKLYNLLTLGLRNCRLLENLPEHLGNLRNLRHLDIGLDGDFSAGDGPECRVASVLRSMPQEIGMLKHLQTLPRFVMAKGKGCGGALELKELTGIHGDLHISNLDNFSIVNEEVGSGILSDMGDLDRVKLQWGSGPSPVKHKLHWGGRHSSGENCSRADHQRVALEKLQPHENIKELVIVGYMGDSLPSWISDPSFCNLVAIKLINCKIVSELPPLGQLPSLKSLFIEGMDAVHNMDCRRCFCENGTVTGFPKLRKLQFVKMRNWKEWSQTGDCNYPLLQDLIIKDCPFLLQLTHTFPSLIKLEVEGCPKLICLAGLPSLRSLLLRDVGEAIWDSLPHLTSLKSLEINYCPHLTELQDIWLPTQTSYLGIMNCHQLHSLAGFSDRPLLEDFKILDCPRLAALPDEMKNLQRLERLEISCCSQLQGLPNNGVPRSLRIFSVSNCPSLSNRCRPGGMDWHKIRYIPSVWIDGVALEQHDSSPSTRGRKQHSYTGQSSRT